jgi:hypothetical protein
MKEFLDVLHSFLMLPRKAGILYLSVLKLIAAPIMGGGLGVKFAGFG